MKYRLKVNQPNKIFTLRGKPTRTPFYLDNVTETELKMFKSKIKLESIPEDKYEIIPMEEVYRMENEEQQQEKPLNKTKKENTQDTKKEKENKTNSNLTLDSYSEE